MQDLQEEKSQKKKKGLRRQVELPVALSVIVAAFALFSVASFGLINRQVDTVSYAAPEEGFNLVMNNQYGSPEVEAGLAGIYDGYTTNEDFYVPYYYVGSVGDNNRIFCVEHGVDASTGVPYEAGDYVDDFGLIYILKNGNNILGTGGKAEIWAKQAAIWLYQHETHEGDTKHALPATGLDSIDTLKKVTKVEVRGGPNSGTKYDVPGAYTKIKAFVDQAKAAASEGEPAFNFTINRGEQMTKTSDGKYYQTSLISIVGDPADALVSYDIVNLKGVEGIKIVDENGKDLAATNIPAAKKFYLRIPVDKISEKTVNISYSVNAIYDYSGARYFVADNHQTLIDLDTAYGQYEKGDGFNIVGSVPDTGMNAAQTIYFIGLIVLLCGVGIVYANTKPVESKQ